MQANGSPTCDACSSRTVVVIWCLNDGRTGHRRQMEGLLRQLGEHRPLTVHWIPVNASRHADFLGCWARRRFPPGRGLPAPQLIIGAGHLTHVAALAAQRACGGKTLILMRPTLPPQLFDLCLVPEHDLESFFSRIGRSLVVPTRGVLNPFVPVDGADPTRALILIGGPSRHHGWANNEVLEQMRQIIRLGPTNLTWTLATSRRTPELFTAQLSEVITQTPAGPHIHIVPYATTHPGWLAEQLTKSRTAFVTEDSVSMVYEALTVGADVGLLRVPRRSRGSRNARCIDRLIAERLVVPFDQWEQTRFEHRQQISFNEAARCAKIVCERLLDAA